MPGNPRFWVFMAVFQLAFGLGVFALTRNYYAHETGAARDTAVVPSSVSGARLPDDGKSEMEQLISSIPGPQETADPFELAAMADEAFDGQQFERAADLYHQLLMADPGNVDTYNNLGLTLHYLGRTGEALGVLNEGVGVDPNYQRIWLTLGFVNAQAGQVQDARTALGKAVELGAETEVGRSASDMLQSLGPG
jgi:Flp pilus assembly protein TadD